MPEAVRGGARRGLERRIRARSPGFAPGCALPSESPRTTVHPAPSSNVDGPVPTTATSPPGQSERLHLAEANLDLIAVVLGKAIKAGALSNEVVVLILDTRDEVARELATAIIDRQGGLDLDAEEARVLGRGQIPTAFSVLPLRLAKMLFAVSYPGVSSGLGRVPPLGRVRVVVVGAGGVTLMHLPVTAVSTGAA